MVGWQRWLGGLAGATPCWLAGLQTAGGGPQAAGGGGPGRPTGKISGKIPKNPPTLREQGHVITFSGVGGVGELVPVPVQCPGVLPQQQAGSAAPPLSCRPPSITLESGQWPCSHRLPPGAPCFFPCPFWVLDGGAALLALRCPPGWAALVHVPGTWPGTWQPIT